MNWWNRLLRRNTMETQLDKELQFHLDFHTNDLIEKGYEPKEALRMAKLTLGGPEQVKEKCRDARGTRWFEDLLQDFRYAARILRQRPGFTIVSVLTLALGIGAVTAIFSAVNPILFEPLPYPNANRSLTISYAGLDRAHGKQSFGNYEEIASRSHSFEAVAVFKPWQPTLTGDIEPERFDGQRVTANYFQALGISPALGRDFEPADDQFRGPNVAILSNRLWQRRFNSDTKIVGRQISLNDSSFTVIGVMPAGFENVLLPSADIWSTLQYNPALPVDGREWGHHLDMVARLRPGVSVDQARRELDTIAHNPVPEFTRPAWSSAKDGFIVNSLQDDITGAIKPTLLVVLGAVIVLLLIACVNVANLLLARSAQRRGEFAMRVALGARRTRLVRQMLTESLLLAIIGGILGMVVAENGVGALVALSPAGLPRISAIRIDAVVFAFGFGITTLIGVAIGLIPALSASRTDLLIGLREGSRRTAGGHQLMRRALVVAEVALALVLLVSAGLLFRSLDRLFAIPPGFNPDYLVAMQVQVASPNRYRKDNDYHRFYDQALEAVRTVPGVTAAGFTAQLPLSGDDPALEIYKAVLEPNSDGSPNEAAVSRYAVTPGYFETMGIPILQGRVFDKHDVADAPVRPVVISESFARNAFPGKNPIGQRIKMGGSADRPWDEIVGVVGDVKQGSLSANPADAVYVNTDQWLWAESPLWLVVRARGDAASFVPNIKKAVWSIDKDQPIVRVSTMNDLVAASEAQRHFALIVFEAFALVALTLAAIGIYGVMSGSVTERIREIGVRTALGATRGNILALVFRQGIGLTVIGTIFGLLGAFAASKALVSLLYGVTRLDPATYTGVIVLLIVVSVAACWAPAWRAARVDPAITLRAE
ncbi:MAG TPA: ABC transporter permease [Blastocatellia bacterium]|nr:ABC transporter permease [Blastocatellia bacterium]